MNRNYIIGSTSQSFFLFFISHSSGRLFSFGDCGFIFKGWRWRVLILHKILLIIWDQIVLTLHPQVLMRQYMKCLQTWIDKDKVLLQLQLLLLILLACSMPMSSWAWVNHSSVGIQHMFSIIWPTPKLFKTLTNFILVEFDKLTLLMSPTIVWCALSTCEHHIQILDLRVVLTFLF